MARLRAQTGEPAMFTHPPLVLLAVVMAAAIMAGGGSGDGVSVGGLPVGYWLRAQSTTPSPGGNPAAAAAGTPVTSGQQAAASGAQAPTTGTTAQASCGFQLSYCQASGIN